MPASVELARAVIRRKEKYPNRRLGWCDLWVRATPEGNPYGHPVSGLQLVVDMNTHELLEIDNDHSYGQPEVDCEYVPSVRGIEPRTDVKPLHILSARRSVVHPRRVGTEVAQLDHATGFPTTGRDRSSTS